MRDSDFNEKKDIKMNKKHKTQALQFNKLIENGHKFGKRSLAGGNEVGNKYVYECECCDIIFIYTAYHTTHRDSYLEFYRAPNRQIGESGLQFLNYRYAEINTMAYPYSMTCNEIIIKNLLE